MTHYLATIRYEADSQPTASEVAASMVRLFAGWNASVVNVEPDEPEFCEHEPYRDDELVNGLPLLVLRCHKCPAVSVALTGANPPPLSPWQFDPSAPPVPAQALSPALLDELRQMMREEAHAAVESHEGEHQRQALRIPKESTTGDVTSQLLLIKSLDAQAYVGLSEFTGKWYVSARIEIGGDGMLSGVTEHRDTPHAAVDAFMQVLTGVPVNKYLVVHPSGHRRHYRWNGAAFAELPIAP